MVKQQAVSGKNLDHSAFRAGTGSGETASSQRHYFRPLRQWGRALLDAMQ